MPKVILLDTELLGMVTHPAEFWARARNEGYPTADPKALDADVILAAQAQSFGNEADIPVIATTNLGYMSCFTTADLWENIK